MEEFTFDTRVAFLSLFRSRLDWMGFVLKVAEAFLVKFRLGALLYIFINIAIKTQFHGQCHSLPIDSVHSNNPSTPYHQDEKQAP